MLSHQDIYLFTLCSGRLIMLHNSFRCAVLGFMNAVSAALNSQGSSSFSSKS